MVKNMSKSTLKNFVDAGYKNKREASNVNGDTLDKDLSTRRDKIYVSPEGQVVHSIAGTDTMKDWTNNALILLLDLFKKAHCTSALVLDQSPLSLFALFKEAHRTSALFLGLITQRHAFQAIANFTALPALFYRFYLTLLSAVKPLFCLLVSNSK